MPDFTAYDAQVNAFVAQQENDQASHKAQNGKNQRLARAPLGQMFTEVTEYVTPSNDTGYEIRFIAKDGDDVYVKTVATGPEAADRTFDWQVEEREIYG